MKLKIHTLIFLWTFAVGVVLVASIERWLAVMPELPPVGVNCYECIHLYVEPCSCDDDTRRIQAAIDKASERGGTVHLGGGVYKVHGAIHVRAVEYLAIQGSDNRAILQGDDRSPLFVFEPAAEWGEIHLNALTVEDVTVDICVR